MENNYAFVDTQNINLSVRDQWRKLDRKKLRIYLKEKYWVIKAYLFIGYIPWNQQLYSFLQDVWYHLIFKSVMELASWKTKWNVDAELVLQAMIDYDNYSKAVIITGDWDFACLVRHLSQKEKFHKLIVPNIKKYSIFLRQAAWWRIDSFTNLREKLEYKNHE